MVEIKRYAGRRLVLCILFLMLLAMPTGCGNEESEATPASGQTSPTSEESTPAAEEPEQAEKTDCSWTLSVEDTKTVTVNGYNMTCTLQISAVKDDGANSLGTYTGFAALSYTYDMQKGNIKGNANGAGQDENVRFEMVAYNVKTYTSHGVTVKNGELPPIGPITEEETMALGTFALSGSGKSNESAGSANWSTEDSKTVQVPFKIAVYKGEAIIELPTIAPGAIFKGTLTGTFLE